ncbi:hypothetical protein ACQPWY_27375 [Pseudonocardia xinjiangensis]|uniref:hypothetical protein n=1 Tax=Pseudonocardia xinjiangensis TaxID=75289 RepID=UPI003D8FDB84
MPLNRYLDFSEIAALYSQLAGVLAGFSFAALIAIATVRLNESRPQKSVTSAYRPLMCSFFALVATSLNYAVMVGEKERSGRSAAVGAAAGVGFVAAGCLLVFAILVTLDTVENARPDRTGNAQKAVRLIRRIMTLVVPPLFVTLWLPALRDHKSVKYGSGAPFGMLDTSGLLAIGISATVSAALFLRYHRLSRSPSTTDLLSTPGVGVALASLFATGGYVTFMGEDAFVVDAVPLVELVLVTGLGVVTSFAACRFQSGSNDEGPEPGSSNLSSQNEQVGLSGQQSATNREADRSLSLVGMRGIGMGVIMICIAYAARILLARRPGR